VARPFAPLGAHLLNEIPRIWTVAAGWPHIVRLLFFPMDLIADYGPDVIPVTLGWGLQNTLGAGMVLGALVLAGLVWRRGRPLGPEVLSPRALGWGVVWFVITLSPTSNLLFLSGIIVSERTLYLPSVGFVMALAWLLLRLHRERPRMAVGVTVVALILLGVRSWTRTPTWKNNGRVFTTLAQEHPESGRVQWAMGDTYFDQGQISEGLLAYRAAVQSLDNHYNLLTETSLRFMREGLERPAEHLLLRAWDDRPEFRRAPELLAGLYDRGGRHADAEKAARGALDLDPGLVLQHHHLSRALRGQGRLEEAVESRMTVIRLGEAHRWQQWAWLAQLRLEMGDSSATRAALDSARVRGATHEEIRLIDSTLVGLFSAPEAGGETPVSVPQGARDSQIPRPMPPDEASSEAGVPGLKHEMRER
jgi:tetratricopeptide (TPR) repeat protein